MLVAAGVFGLGIGGGVLVSAATTSPTISGCVNNQTNQATLRITADPTGFGGSPCNKLFEHAITFNTAGPPGPAGPTGPQGATGPSGAAGSPTAGAGGGATGQAKPASVNFIAMAAFLMPAGYYVVAELDCPKGDFAQGGTAAMISPLGNSPAIGNAAAGPGITSPVGHPAIGWIGQATNGSAQAASLKLSVICTGPDLNAANAAKRVVLLRKLRRTKGR